MSKKLSYAQANSILLTKLQEEVLMGTILGDGSLKRQKNYKNVRFQMKHSLKQKDGFYWKVGQLDTLSSLNSVFLQEEPYSVATQGKLYKKLRFQTRALPCLTQLHDACYTNNVLDFNKPWLYNDLTERSIMIGWLDDGSVTKRRRGKLATQGLTEHQNIELKNYFQQKWGIKCSVCTNVYSNGKKYYFLQFYPEMLKRLLKLIMPFIPVKSMIYKTLLVYKDLDLQQDWIRTMKKTLNPRFHGLLPRFLIRSRKKIKISRATVKRKSKK